MGQLLAIGGPTASGKSALALAAAEKFAKQGLRAEILCADSITVYRGFEIGAAKPSAAERAQFPHHLLDLAEANEPFTAADFVNHAQPIVERLLAEGAVPILAGGSGFYLRALLRGMAGENEDHGKAAEIKGRLEERGRIEGFTKLHSELIRQDPGSASIVHPNDHYRIVRALQAMEIQGKPWSELNRLARATPPKFPHAFFRILPEREILRERVKLRTAAMLQEGLLEEVRALLASGIAPSAKPMQSVGYKECVENLLGEFPLSQLAEKIENATMKLAKAQATWFRGEELAVDLPAPYTDSLESRLESWP